MDSEEGTMLSGILTYLISRPGPRKQEIEKLPGRFYSAMKVLAICVCCLTPTLPAATITSVIFSVGPANPTIQINGFDFNPQPSPDELGFPGFIGNDYGNQLYLIDLTNDPASFGAGADGPTGRDTIGLIILSYTDQQITYQLGTDYEFSYYPSHVYGLNTGDAFTVGVHGATFSGIVAYSSAVPEPASAILVAISFVIGGCFAIQQRRRRKH